MSIEVQNNAQRVDLTSKPTFVEPVCDLFPGLAYWELRVEGLFQQQLNFIKFPLDSHDLIISVEVSFDLFQCLLTKSQDTQFARNDLLYQLDTSVQDGLPASGIKRGVALSGWYITTLIFRRLPIPQASCLICRKRRTKQI